MVHLAGRSQRGRARPLYCLVITLDRIRLGTAVGAPKSEPPAYASESSVSGQLLVMCVPGACGVAGTVCGSCACEMGLLCALVITTCRNYRLHRYSVRTAVFYFMNVLHDNDVQSLRYWMVEHATLEAAARHRV